MYSARLILVNRVVYELASYLELQPHCYSSLSLAHSLKALRYLQPTVVLVIVYCSMATASLYAPPSHLTACSQLQSVAPA
jgi:hypothetical protein